MSTRHIPNGDPKSYWKTTQKKLRTARRRTRVTFLQCRGIIQLVINGVSVEKIVDRTGISRSNIMQILKVTKQILARDAEPGTGMPPFAS